MVPAPQGPGRHDWERLLDEGALEGLALPWPVTAAEPLRLHASTRSFFRLHAGADVEPASVVLVVYPPDDVEGIERYGRVAAWMAAAGVRVPAILGTGRRALVVEDGGDALLADATLDDAGAGEAYATAVDALVAVQRHGALAGSPNPAWALDAERLAWELQFTERHALRGWLRASSGARLRERGFARLVEVVSALPVALCHRDFHARNLLILEGPGGRRQPPPRQESPGVELMVLDFQDAMAGPILYDPASLLWDNYRDVPESVIDAVLQRFWHADRGSDGVVEPTPQAAVPDLPAGLPPAARQAFCLVAAQRHLKALGTFGYQIAVAGKAGYARYAARTWGHVRTALEELQWHELIEGLRVFEAVS